MSLCKHYCKRRSAKGQSIAETAASLSILLPLFVLLTFTTAEIVRSYLIKNCLTAAASEAARGMTIQYWQNGQIAVDRNLQDSLVYNQIRLVGIVADSRQFANATFDTGATPKSVTVTVTYSGGKYGLPTFPSPDPLNLGPMFTISASETHALE